MIDEGSSRSAADDRGRLVALLRRLGAGEEEIDEALDLHSPGALALEAALRHGRPPMSPEEAARSAAMTDAEFADLWRALGFTTPVGPVRVAPALVDALPIIASANREWLGEETGLGLARVIGSTTAQLAEAVVDAFRMRYEVPELAAGAAYSEVVERYVEMTRAALPSLEQLVAATFEAHLVRVAAGAWAPDDDQVATRRLLFVGFADLVGYTALSRTLTPGELHQLLQAFEEIVSGAVIGHGGRLVKLIGDGAMYVADSAAAGGRAGPGGCRRGLAGGGPPGGGGARLRPAAGGPGGAFRA